MLTSLAYVLTMEIGTLLLLSELVNIDSDLPSGLTSQIVGLFIKFFKLMNIKFIYLFFFGSTR